MDIQGMHRQATAIPLLHCQVPGQNTYFLSDIRMMGKSSTKGPQLRDSCRPTKGPCPCHLSQESEGQDTEVAFGAVSSLTPWSTPAHSTLQHRAQRAAKVPRACGLQGTGNDSHSVRAIDLFTELLCLCFLLAGEADGWGPCTPRVKDVATCSPSFSLKQKHNEEGLHWKMKPGAWNSYLIPDTCEMQKENTCQMKA